MAAARWRSARNPDERTVVMLPDQGERYLDTVYNDEWLDQVSDRRPTEESGPREVIRPTADRDWTWLRWARRSLDEVLE